MLTYVSTYKHTNIHTGMTGPTSSKACLDICHIESEAEVIELLQETDRIPLAKLRLAHWQCQLLAYGLELLVGRLASLEEITLRDSRPRVNRMSQDKVPEQNAIVKLMSASSSLHTFEVSFGGAEGYLSGNSAVEQQLMKMTSLTALDLRHLQDLEDHRTLERVISSLLLLRHLNLSQSYFGLND
jgi:hypothetical protein